MGDSQVRGNSTLFEGAKIETLDAASDVSLSNGVRVRLSAGSSARVWQGHLDLEKGSGVVNSTGAFRVNAGTMAVEGARYRVDRQETRLQVAALTGNARVLGEHGSILAAVAAGGSRSFAMQQTVTRTGCLVYKGNGYLFQVDNSPDVFQLIGGPLAENVGNHIMVTGSLGTIAPTVSPASLILNVTSLLLRSTGGCLSAAAALNAQTSVQPATGGAPETVSGPAASPAKVPVSVAKTGMSTGAKVGIVAAVAGGGAGAALALGGKKSSTSP